VVPNNALNGTLIDKYTNSLQEQEFKIKLTKIAVIEIM